MFAKCNSFSFAQSSTYMAFTSESRLWLATPNMFEEINFNHFEMTLANCLHEMEFSGRFFVVHESYCGFCSNSTLNSYASLCVNLELTYVFANIWHWVTLYIPRKTTNFVSSMCAIMRHCIYFSVEHEIHQTSENFLYANRQETESFVMPRAMLKICLRLLLSLD